MSSEANNVTLSSLEDWESWERQFKIQAIDLQHWSHFIDGEPLLEKPKKPEISSYQTQAQTRTMAGRSQTVDAKGSQPSELANQDRLGYQLDMQLYIQEEKEFKEQTRSVQKLRKWVMNSVASHYVLVACEPEEVLHQWYDNLKIHVGISNAKAEQTARDRYKEALKPLTKPKDWSNWLSNWEKVVFLAKKKKVPEALSISA
jgi:hypothetical protein